MVRVKVVAFLRKRNSGWRGSSDKVETVGFHFRNTQANSQATRYIDLDRLAIGTQCGFASTVAGNPLTEADERAKLALIVEAAKAIWR